MTQFTITGKPTQCSREYVRAWLQASACVLAYHSKHLPDGLAIQFRDEHELADAGMPYIGRWDGDGNRVLLLRTLEPEDMATTILHELVHAACGYFGEETDEKCCSTLTARLKAEVKKLAEPLLEGTYKRAAYLAHTKLSYTVDEDRYDTDEDRPIGVSDRYSPKKRAPVPA